MALTAERIVDLKAAAEALGACGWGERGEQARTWAERLGCTVQTLYAQLRQAGFALPRKTRSDAGRLAVSREEAMRVMALKTMAQRANGKDILGYRDAAELIRANGLAALGTLDQDTGELRPVHEATLAKAVRHYGLHLKTLRAPAAHLDRRSNHPNHVWQIDASVCVLYYLDDGGLAVAEADEFYKNKPENQQRKIKAMVVRFVCVDHYTGTVHFRYYLGSESSENLLEFLFDCLLPKGDEREPFQGVPFLLVTDPGGANKGTPMANVCRLLRIDLRHHKPKNARATGSVEVHNNIIERGFESRLIGRQIRTLEELNDQATKWRRWFNGTAKHTRHGHTRYGLWQTIRADQLRLAPPAEVLRALPTSRPEPRRVAGNMTISWRGAGYRVDGVPHLSVGQTVTVAINPYVAESVLLIEVVEGRDVYWVCPRVQLDAAGFRLDARGWDEDIRVAPDTPAIKDRKALEKLAYGVEGKLEVDAARKSRKPAFGGLDIADHLEAETPARYMTRPGVVSDLETPLQGGKPGEALSKPAAVAVEPARLSLVALAQRLIAAMPGEWSAEHYQRLTAWYPQGAHDGEVPHIIERLRNFGNAPRLIAVG